MSNFAIGMVLKGITITPVFTASTNPLVNSEVLVNTVGEVIAPDTTYSSNAVTWFSDIRDPNGAQLNPPPVVGTDIGRVTTYRGYTSMTWTYNLIRAEEWYYLQYLWRLSRQTAGQNGGHVWIRWPDPESGEIQTVSARWDLIDSSQRDVGAFTNITLSFSRLGIDNSQHIPGIFYDH